MIIAGIRQCSTTDGPGRRFVVLLPGCQHHCTGCQASQGPGSGVDFPMEELLEQMEAQDVEGLSISGGEPFDQPEALVPLARTVREQGKTVWCWTSRVFEELVQGTGAQRDLLGQIDVLVDGPFQPKLAASLPWRSSGNQRCVQVPESLDSGTTVLWEP